MSIASMEARVSTIPAEDSLTSVVAPGGTVRSDPAGHSMRDQSPQGVVRVAGWGTAMAEADEVSVRLRNIEESLELLRKVLPQERVASERLDGIETALQGMRAEIAAAGGRTRSDWDLLSIAVRRAEVLKAVEGAALDRIAVLEKQLSTLERWVGSMVARGQTWGAIFFVLLAAGILTATK